MGLELARGEGFNVVRTWDREMILDIRNHKYEYEEIIEYVEKVFAEMKELAEKCDLPETADIQKAVLIAENAKLQRPGVCNAMETLLVHKNIAKEFLPELVKKFDNRAELRCCSESYQIINALNLMKDDKLKLATEDDFGFEFLDNILAIKVVENIEQAILHINSHNTKHSEAIITQNISNAKKFQSEIDASSVYVNASTRFTDGFEFGFGAEIGISTQKLHARGPMGLKELTSYKYKVRGTGQIRG